jgi:hypothetical protein
MKERTERELYGPDHRSAKPIPTWALGLLVVVALVVLAYAIASITPYFRQDAVDGDELPGVTEPNPPE